MVYIPPEPRYRIQAWISLPVTAVLSVIFCFLHECKVNGKILFLNCSLFSLDSLLFAFSDKPIGTQLSSNNTKPLVNRSVAFSCTADAVPAAKYHFVRIDGSGEREVSSFNSELTGILLESRIMHTSNAYNVTYKCTPYNMLGNGLEQTVMVDIQGK